MEFFPNKVAFGRHESFPLRYGWLTKGFQAFEKQPDIFSGDDAIVTLGVGKNMVNSIRHWLRAAQLIIDRPDKKETTPLGVAIFSEDGWDPYLEDEATIWLIHWLLSTNPQHATTWYWFFNRFHKPEFTSKEVSTSLLDFAEEKIATKTSITTIQKDATVLLRMYVQTRTSNQTTVEEALDSPLSLLKLITYSPLARTYQTKLVQREGLSCGILGFAVTQLFKYKAQTEIPIEDLMYKKNDDIALGQIFRLSEIALLTKLEQLISNFPGIYEIRDTAGVHQMHMLKDVDPQYFLAKHYEVGQKYGKAA